MTSQTQFIANRENAQNSTGPKSAGGKAHASRNAVKHNLSSVSPILAGEDKLAFEHFLFESKLDLAPSTHTEHMLVEQVAFAEWKLLRIAQWETQIIDATLANQQAPCEKLFGKSPDDALARLHRHEASVRRAWHNALRELRQMKKLNHSPAQVQDRSQYIVSVKQRMEKVVRIADSKTNPIAPSPAPAATPAAPTVIQS